MILGGWGNLGGLGVTWGDWEGLRMTICGVGGYPGGLGAKILGDLGYLGELGVMI